MAVHSHRHFSPTQIPKHYKVSFEDVHSALTNGELQYSYVARKTITETDVLLWLLRTDRISVDELRGIGVGVESH